MPTKSIYGLLEVIGWRISNQSGRFPDIVEQAIINQIQFSSVPVANFVGAGF